MNKYIEKVELYKKKTLGNALEKLKAEYEEAKDYYTDSGHDRYFKKMNKCEEQINEIEEYLSPDKEDDSLIADDYKELLMLRKVVDNVKSKVFYLSKDLPACADLINLQDMLRDF